jgi:hypothetical protein
VTAGAPVVAGKRTVRARHHLGTAVMLTIVTEGNRSRPERNVIFAASLLLLAYSGFAVMKAPTAQPLGDFPLPSRTPRRSSPNAANRWHHAIGTRSTFRLAGTGGWCEASQGNHHRETVISPACGPAAAAGAIIERC